jgi:chemotaxis protein methyltransferase CheR
MSVAQNDHLSIPDGVPALMRDLIHERTGIYFDSSRLDTMVEKIHEPAVARQCSSLLDYYYLLKYDASGHAEWDRVMDALSVQETYFWREMSQVDALIKVLIPNWFKGRAGPLRIWSAACASGEEPYTLAMTLEEAGLGHYPIRIIASDASSAALAKARQGIYRERSFRSLPVHLRDKYFDPHPNGSKIKREIASRVEFHQANLVSRTDLMDLATAPVIFCRNVFIYFSSDAIRRTIAVFAEMMPPQGSLCVGASESLLKLTQDFDLQEIGDAFVYVRREHVNGGPR